MLSLLLSRTLWGRKKRGRREILAKVLTFRVKAEEELENGRKTKVLKSYFKPPQPTYYHPKTEILPATFLDLMRIRRCYGGWLWNVIWRTPEISSFELNNFMAHGFLSSLHMAMIGTSKRYPSRAERSLTKVGHLSSGSVANPHPCETLAKSLQLSKSYFLH